MKAIAIIPAYNEEESIVQVVKKIREDCPEVDYIVVNDCSGDSTAFVLKENNINYISLPINLGIGGCVQTGYQYALTNGYDIAIQVDGDGQHDTKYLRRMIQIIEQEEADIVIGSRFIEREGFQSTKCRRLGIYFLSAVILGLTGVKVFDVTSGYRAVNHKFINNFSKQYAVDYPEPEAIVEAAKRRACIKEVPVVMKERAHGRSSINFIKSIYYMIKVTLSIILCRVSN